MKFKIKYADKIVGFFSILAIGALIVVIFSIGSKQNWFEKKYHFRTQFESASNISAEQALQYKGFTIGKVSKVELIDDKVWADWYILEKYINYARDGSLVEMVVSPIGLGNQFVFHPGNSNIILKENSVVYTVDCDQGQKIIKEGRVDYEKPKDSIGAIIKQVTSLINDIDNLVVQINDILSGKSAAPTSQILYNVSALTAQLQTLLGGVNSNLYPQINGIISQINSIAAGIEGITVNANSLMSDAGTIVNNSSPQLNSALNQINTLLLQVSDVLEGVKNNPLIKNGVPDHSSTTSALPQSRSGGF